MDDIKVTIPACSDCLARYDCPQIRGERVEELEKEVGDLKSVASELIERCDVPETLDDLIKIAVKQQRGRQ